MIIGFDASRAFVGEPTGTENYSYELLQALLHIDKKNNYRVYINPYRTKRIRNQESGIMEKNHDSLFMLHNSNVEVKPILWPRLWTQGGLAWECLKNPPDVLFIPAHTLPVIRRPGLKTVVTIHDLGAEYLPQYHQFPQKYYLNWSTTYAVKHATKIVAVSKSTKKDIITKLGCDIQKINVIYEGIKNFVLKTYRSGNEVNGN